MSLSDHLDALERGCLRDAPHLVHHVRRARQALGPSGTTLVPTTVNALSDPPLGLKPVNLDPARDGSTSDVPAYRWP